MTLIRRLWPWLVSPLATMRRVRLQRRAALVRDVVQAVLRQSQEFPPRGWR